MTAFQTEQLALAEQQPALPFLAQLNQQGKDAFAVATIPTRKTENFKYTSLLKLTQAQYGAASNHKATDALINAATIKGLNAARLVFINGQVVTELSDALALKEVVLFSQANSEQQQLINDKLGKSVGNAHKTSHLFNDLNNAATREGVLVHIGRNQKLENSLQISHLTTSDAQPFSLNQRLLVVLEQGAQANLVEHYGSDEQEQVSFTNALTEIYVGDNASLQHYRLLTMQEQAQHIGSAYTDLHRDSQYQAFHLSLGSALSRSDIVVNHNVGGSHAELSGVYIPQHQDVVDYHSCIEHRAAHCTSNEVFRGIMNDRAKAVFNGRIHIWQNAQKSDAQLNNKNLLLTNTAEIYTKPELEIYADDVKCAHGATVAQLDDKSVFYLQSRGISKKDAEIMLSFGFINELLEALPDEAITQFLRPMLEQRFQTAGRLSQELLEDLK